MSRLRRGDAVAIRARACSRWPLDPFPAERASRRSWSPSQATAPAQVSFTPVAMVRVKSDGTRGTCA